MDDHLLAARGIAATTALAEGPGRDLPAARATAERDGDPSHAPDHGSDSRYPTPDTTSDHAELPSATPSRVSVVSQLGPLGEQMERDARRWRRATDPTPERIEAFLANAPAFHDRPADELAKLTRRWLIAIEKARVTAR